MISIMLIAFLAPLSASAISYTLQICGNANMDETINDADVSYIEKVIKGEAEETKLSDANNDGTVDEKDVDQIKKIIAGDEEFLVVLEDTGGFVKIAQPVQSFVYHGHNTYVYETLRAIGALTRSSASLTHSLHLEDPDIARPTCLSF